jgi:hypothetical protein
MKNDKLIIGSNELFSQKYKNSFYDLLKNEHNIYKVDRSSINSTQDIYESIKYHMDNDYKYKTFIGCYDDVEILFDLYLDHNISFDTAIFVNGRFSTYPRINDQKLSTGLANTTKIYNLYGRGMSNQPLTIAHINQYIPTFISPELSSKFSLEAYGLLVYGVYQLNYLEDTTGRISHL